MKKMYFFAALLLMAMPGVLNAQSSNILYGSSRNPMMNSVNPAFFPNSTRLYLSLPNINVDFTSPVSYSEVITYDPELQKTIINANQVFDKLTQNSLLFNTNIHAAGIGINLGHLFLTASTQVKANVSVGIPHGLSTLINEGNVNYLGPDNPLELLDGHLVSIQSYAEGAVGIGLKLGDRLTLGVRGKFLAGIADFSNAGSSLKLITAEDYSSLTADMHLNFHLASAGHVDYDSIKDEYSITYPKNKDEFPKNYGYNFDIGFRYATDLFELSASVLDLGPGIHWQESLQRVISKHENNQIVFSGVDVSNDLHDGQLDQNLVDNLIDSLKQMTEIKLLDVEDDYWTVVPTKINLGGMLNLSRGLSAGILFRGEFERSVEKVDDLFETKTTGFHSSTSILARINIADWIEVVAATSVVTNDDKWSWVNPGFGLTLTPLRKIQIYTFLDYISDIYVIDAKRFNMSFGMNLLLGRERKKNKVNTYVDF